MRLRIVAAVSLDRVGLMPRSTPPATHLRNLLQQGKQLADVIAVRFRQANRQGNAVAIRQHMMLTTAFAPICGIWACFSSSGRGAERSAVHDRTGPIDLVMLLQFGQEIFE